VQEPEPVEESDDLAAERAARNEVRFREANEQIDERRRELGVEGDRFPVLCECQRPSCTEVILIAPEEYAAVRAHARRFVVLADHDRGSRVVARHDGFVVVEKEGREGEVVEALVRD